MNMKQIKSLLAAALVAAVSVGFTGCNEDLETPPLSIPSTDWKANTSILELKTQYWSDQENYCTEVGTTATGEHVIIGGRIIGNDITGNIYQAIQIQDASAAITVSVSMKNLNERYKVGEEIYIDVTGLYAGKYAGLFQIGDAGTYNNNPTTSKMTEEQFTAASRLNGLPVPSEVKAVPLTIAQINSMVKNTADVQLYQSQLVEINDVSFIGGGTLTWAEQGSSGTDRYLIDAGGNRLLVRNSGYSDFADQLLPEGHGNVKAILSWYRSGWQVVFRSNEDCTDFGGESYAPGGGEAVVSSLDVNFEGCSSITDLGNWVTSDQSGNATWFTQSRDDNTFAACTGYNKTAGSDGFISWLITPGLDIDKMDKKVFSFESMVGYTGVNNILEVYAMTSNDPAKATLTKLNANIPTSTGSFSDWIKSGNIDLSQFSGKVIYIGFCYKAPVAADNNYNTYRIDNVLAGKEQQAGSDPDQPVTGNATFEKVTSITSGSKYALVIDGQVGTPIGESLSYGRLAMNAVTIANNSFTAAANNAITVTAVQGGYTLVDCYGRYLGMDDNESHQTSFQLYTSNTGDGCVWTISFESDGTATIANVLNPDCHIVKSGTFTNIAPSNVVKYTTFTAPTVYLMK